MNASGRSRLLRPLRRNMIVVGADVMCERVLDTHDFVDEEGT
jgi:hypothetical protein